MKETFRYKGYTVVLRGPMRVKGLLRVTARVVFAPKTPRMRRCPCTHKGYLHAQSTRIIDGSLTTEAQEVRARQIAPVVKKLIEKEIDLHRCFTP